jgi:hypothetical protein
VRGSRLVACLNFTHDEPWIAYAEGFKRLADVGVAHIEETGHGHDFLVYPIVYAYRHHIELSLKLITSSVRESTFTRLTSVSVGSSQHRVTPSATIV